MQISITELQQIVSILVSEIKSAYGATIIINDDYFWDLDEEQIFDPLEKPDVLGLGSLNEDWNELKRLLVKDSIPISYDLKRLATLLFAIRKSSSDLW